MVSDICNDLQSFIWFGHHVKDKVESSISIHVVKQSCLRQKKILQVDLNDSIRHKICSSISHIMQLRKLYSFKGMSCLHEWIQLKELSTCEFVSDTCLKKADDKVAYSVPVLDN